MAEKPKPSSLPSGKIQVRNGQVKGAPNIVKTAVAAPPATKPKST